ncbi:hypothetical protein BN946_scf184842.g19 [Trametes cinnabarina]|uniref:GST N-terminal domain-containing protein n=1 Tax=Pycnoporus cinnabarinus TaxID=5643 RepID=A0A060S271_PYCCI|nr:hypothetical protein BN946_scf184842.g19 [Trametes cinnabarina]
MTSSILLPSLQLARRPSPVRLTGPHAFRKLAATPSARSGCLKSYSTATSPSSKPLLLYTAGTPNGRKASIYLEELKAQYGLAYDVHRVDFKTAEQKRPWYLALNPNGRIPTLVDRNRPSRTLPTAGGAAQEKGFAVFESAAILLYLAQHYDTQRKFAFDARQRPEEWSEMLQWMFFAHGGIGPMQGQGYLEETKRLYGVLNVRLAGREWLAGPGQGKYSIADINAFPWVNAYSFAGIETLDEWPNVKAWIERLSERPAVKAGLQVP